MNKQDLLRALQTEIRRHDFDTFVDTAFGRPGRHGRGGARRYRLQEKVQHQWTVRKPHCERCCPQVARQALEPVR